MLDQKAETILKANSFKNRAELNIAHFQITQMKELISLENKKILDIGCGKGEFLILCSLAENVSHCVGLDSAMGEGSKKDTFEIFKNDINLLDIENIDTIQADIFEYDFPKEKFDIIVTNYSLHHIIFTNNNLLKCPESKEKATLLFNNICNSLRPNGVFVIKEISKNNLCRYWRSYGKLVGTEQMAWLSKHTPKEYREILLSTNLRNIKVKYLIPYVFKRFGLDKFRFLLSNSIASFFFHSAYYIFAWK